MAVAQLVFGNVTGDGLVLSSDFQSAELDTNGIWTFTSASKMYCIVHAIGTSDIYVAFANGADPDTTKNPRVRIKAGTFMPFSIQSGVRVKVTTAA